MISYQAAVVGSRGVKAPVFILCYHFYNTTQWEKASLNFSCKVGKIVARRNPFKVLQVKIPFLPLLYFCPIFPHFLIPTVLSHPHIMILLLLFLPS